MTDTAYGKDPTHCRHTRPLTGMMIGLLGACLAMAMCSSARCSARKGQS